jgi:LacI family transcriptional regulator
MLGEKKSVNLRTVANRVGLAPCSVSAVLNDTPAAKAIPQATKDRIFRAAAELNYRPNLWARSLRTKRTKMVAAVTADFGRGRVAQVVAGLQNRLHETGYLLALTGLGPGDGPYLTSEFRQKGIEGVVAIDASFPPEFALPVASVDVGYVSSVEGDLRPWLTSMGEAAADSIIRQIESPDTGRRLSFEPTTALRYFDVANARIEGELREPA